MTTRHLAATPAASPEQARKILRNRFGYDAFRPGQERAVSSVLAGRDTLVILPTGGGKSLCFQVPALLFPRLTVVISPLISLMKDQVDALAARGLPAAFINSTLGAAEVADRLARAERGEIKLLYVAPERFDVGHTAERLRTAGVSLLAVDEAHCISEWGHDFRPSYLRLRSVRERLGMLPTVALTATATPEVRNDISRQLDLHAPEVIISGFDRPNLTYHVVRTRTEHDKDVALGEALRRYQGPAIVYASTRRSVDRITGALERMRVSAVAYHAGLDDEHRRGVQEAFMQAEVRAIVATNAFGMGIDKRDVRLVVHHAMPGSLEAYYQEAGRAGRDGLASHCVLLHAFQDRFTHEFFLRSASPERRTVELVHATVQRLADSSGLLRADAAAIAAATRGAAREREVESALRLLAQAGALAVEPSSSARIFVRLLATPERIRRELAAEEHAAELGLLRALWRATGERLRRGALVDPDGLPPGFGGAPGVTALLQLLQERQFVMWERSGGGLRIAPRGASAGALSIDWAALERRARSDMGKLDTMQRYAYATGCRRSFVLRYFGDASANASCGACDNCLGTHQVSAPEPKPSSSARSRSSRGPGGGGVRPTGAGRTAPASHASELPELTPRDAALLAELRALRSSLARAEQVPAYVVFPDRTLLEMAVRRPRTSSALALVRGVGPAKLARYGEQFLDTIQRATDTEAA